MANKKVSQLTSKPAVNLTDLFLIADPTSGQAFKTTISDLGTAIGSGVSSVNTLVGAVVLDTDDIQELVSPTNKWFTDTRARAAISAGTGISYNSGTGVITNAVTSGQIATALGYTPANGANYLALAGGTMGGAITGTIATFASSTSVTALGITLSGATGDGVKITHSAGRAFNIQSSGTGFGILINNETASTSAPFTIQKQGLAVITLTDAGAGSFASTITANGATLTGALNGTSAIFTGDLTLSASNPRLYLTDTDNNPDYFISNTDGTFTIYDVTNSTSRLTISTLNTILNTNLRVDGDVLIKQDSVLGGVSGYTAIASDTDGIFLKLGTASAHAYLVLSSLTNYRNFTFPDATGTIALTSNLASYLPLAGGTLTGALSGTSATFSSLVTISADSGGSALRIIGRAAADAGAVRFFANNNTTQNARIESNSSEFEINSISSLPITLKTNDTTRLTIAASTGAATFSGSVTASGLISGSASIYQTNASGSIASNRWETYNGGATQMQFLFPASGSVAFNNGSDRLLITSAGNVGIGTTTPSQPLEIGGTGNILVAGGGTIFSGAGALFVRAGSGGDLILGANNTNGFARITSGGNVSINSTTDGGYGFFVKDKTAGIIFNGRAQGSSIFQADNNAYNSIVVYSVSQDGYSTAGTTMIMGRNSATARSLNAGGTINASGADYAEYMTKAIEDNIAKGDIVGVDEDGLLTNIFLDAKSFVIKSTDPSYVGGDTWGNVDTIGKLSAKATEEEKQIYNAKLEEARAKVDRIAFSGQVPCNVLGANVGDYIIPINDNGKIKGIAVSNPSFEQYQISVGKVWKIMDDGRAWVAVKIG